MFMKKRILQIILVLAVLLLIIFGINLLKGTDRGTPNQSDKGNPVQPQPTRP
jgi:hypothetical protein